MAPDGGSLPAEVDGSRTGPRFAAAREAGPEELERYASLLEASSEYRVLRRLRSAPATRPAEGMDRRGVFLDVETTGLDPATDQIVELAMLSFDYPADGSRCVAGESFETLRYPGCAIPPAVTALTGIDDAMVAGRSIDAAAVSAFVGPADIVVAHNAEFDRRFCERLGPAFAEKAWACSLREVPWSDEGFEGARLGHLAAGHGLFFDGHRALDDCRAGLEILSRPLPRSGRTALAALLESARRRRWRVRAVGAPFAARTALKSRGYRWHDGADGRPRAWYADVEDGGLDTEQDFLRREVYGRPDAEIRADRLSAYDRYSERC